MKKFLNIKVSIIWILLLLLLCSCGKTLEVNQTLLEEQETLNKAREQVIEKFKDERDVLGTAKFIEDQYKMYSEDEIISTIYNYQSSQQCYDYYKKTNEKDWLEQAKSDAAKIAPGYTGEFNEEIFDYLNTLLGEDWIEESMKLKEDEKAYNSLSLDDKKEIKKFIQGRYDFYDEKEGKYTGDKYTDIIFQETSKKYGIATQYVSNIWSDMEVVESIANDTINEKKDLINYDAILDFNGDMALIAVSEEDLEKFMNALVSKDDSVLEEMEDSLKVAQVKQGTRVDIIEKKMTRAKVKILEGIYENNEVWVLIESLKEK